MKNILLILLSFMIIFATEAKTYDSTYTVKEIKKYVKKVEKFKGEKIVFNKTSVIYIEEVPYNIDITVLLTEMGILKGVVVFTINTSLLPISMSKEDLEYLKNVKITETSYFKNNILIYYKQVVNKSEGTSNTTEIYCNSPYENTFYVNGKLANPDSNVQSMVFMEVQSTLVLINDFIEDVFEQSK